MEPITTVLVGKILWDNLGQPLLDKAKERYAEEFLRKIETTLSKIPFNKQELEIIEAEIINTDNETFNDEKSFLQYIENNQKIVEVVKQLNQREPNINIQVEKGIGYIHTNTGDISF
ncbi:hypothetical protein [Aliarcobacter butzleri]|uniref:hypothetical protein n=1 Tax=Aliarcobacter butzleri TaxID=28197 RepID=UPI001EDA3B8C|nr:hypothetical protein [Aliarcobacter butzleri]MCG3689372.1 hypothetical protein [Aliarcobacter butzleri]